MLAKGARNIPVVGGDAEPWEGVGVGYMFAKGARSIAVLEGDGAAIGVPWLGYGDAGKLCGEGACSEYHDCGWSC